MVMIKAKKTLMATVLIPALTFSTLSPALSASGNQGNGGFFESILPFGKKQVQDPIDNNLQLVQSANQQTAEMQQQLRELTGKVEELNFMVLQMQEQIRQLQSGNSAANIVPIVPPATQNPTSAADGRESFPPAPQPPAALPGVRVGSTNQTPAGSGNGSQDLGSIRFDQNGNIINPTMNNNAVNNNAVERPVDTAGATTQVPQTQTAKELYDIGYQHILAGDYKAAEAVFRAFQERYPSDPMIADASFWLGESLYGQNRYREAAQAYIDVQRNYKESPRGPENLLKLGMSMAQLDEKKVACATFAEVTKRYKTVEPAVLKRVKDEQSRNKCQ